MNNITAIPIDGDSGGILSNKAIPLYLMQFTPYEIPSVSSDYFEIDEDGIESIKNYPLWDSKDKPPKTYGSDIIKLSYKQVPCVHVYVDSQPFSTQTLTNYQKGTGSESDPWVNLYWAFAELRCAMEYTDYLCDPVYLCIHVSGVLDYTITQVSNANMIGSYSLPIANCKVILDFESCNVLALSGSSGNYSDVFLIKNLTATYKDPERVLTATYVMDSVINYDIKELHYNYKLGVCLINVILQLQNEATYLNEISTGDIYINSHIVSTDWRFDAEVLYNSILTTYSSDTSASAYSTYAYDSKFTSYSINVEYSPGFGGNLFNCEINNSGVSRARSYINCDIDATRISSCIMHGCTVRSDWDDFAYYETLYGNNNTINITHNIDAGHWFGRLLSMGGDNYNNNVIATLHIKPTTKHESVHCTIIEASSWINGSISATVNIDSGEYYGIQICPITKSATIINSTLWEGLCIEGIGAKEAYEECVEEYDSEHCTRWCENFSCTEK